MSQTLAQLLQGVSPSSNAPANSLNIDPSGRLLVGTTAARGTFFSGSVTALIQVEGTSINSSSFVQNSNDAAPYNIILGKSRGTTSGGTTVLQSGDAVGRISFQGSDGTSFAPGAYIEGTVDGTPGTGSMPGRLVFSTTPSGSATPTERLRIDSSGRVGIGTTSPGSLLDLRFATSPDNDNGVGNNTLRVWTSSALAANTGGAISLGGVSGGGSSAFGQIAGRKANATSNDYAGYLQFSTNTVGGTMAEWMRIDSSGRVGIGTVSPIYALDVLATGTSIGARIQTNQTDATLSFLGSGGLNGYVRVGATDNNLYFVAGNSERMRIDSSGRLLVGTTAARGNLFNVSNTANIQVEGTTSNTATVAVIANANTSGNVPVLLLGKTRGTTVGSNAIVQNNDLIGFLSFQGADGTNFVESARIETQIDGTPGANNMPGRLVFSTTPSGSAAPVERMRIDNAGNLIKKPGPAARPTPNAGDSGFYSDSGYGDGLSLGNIYAAGGKGYINFFYSTNIIGSVTSVGTTGVAYNTSSDYRLKENVIPVPDGITRLQQLKPSRFNFITDPDRTVDGFIAHEVQAVVPEAITGEKDAEDDDGNPIYQGIDQSKLVPLLTAALQEAIAKIETLELEVNDLKALTGNYSVLYMKAVKALQEAMERIETLELEVNDLKALTGLK